MLRVKASALQAAGVVDATQIETVLVNSLEIARGQQARCWELRTACDLARFWQGQGEARKARKLLRAVYNQFTEGSDTGELRSARECLDRLEMNAGRDTLQSGLFANIAAWCAHHMALALFYADPARLGSCACGQYDL